MTDTPEVQAALRRLKRIALYVLLAAIIIAAWGIFTRVHTRAALKQDAQQASVPVVIMTMPKHTDVGDELVLPAPMLQWLEQAQKGRAGSKTPAMASFPENEQLRLQYMGKLGPNEFLLRLAKDSSTNIPAQFSSELGLTTREGEVLSWLSKGKTNRDIAQILGLSPRTVDKHLEQIYAKLGVENRTAAAAVATSASRRNS